MSKYELGVYEKAMPSSLSWREKLQTAKHAGYDYLEISIDETDEKLDRLTWDAATRRELRNTAEEILPIRSMALSGHRKYPLGHPDPAVQARSLEIFRQAVALAADLGVRVIQLAGYDVYYEEGSAQTREDFKNNLQKGVDMASAAGVLLGFETMETPFMNTVAKAMDAVRAIDSPYLGVYPDLGNITNAAFSHLAKQMGHDDDEIQEWKDRPLSAFSGDAYPSEEAVWEAVDADLESGRGHLLAMHLKETRPEIFRDLLAGDGYVQFAAGIRKAWDLGVRRFVTELWYLGSDQWEADLQRTVSVMRAHLDECP